MSKVASLDEARRLLNNLHPTLLRALVILSVGNGIDSSTKLSRCLNVSKRNARRIISILEKLSLAKTISYRRKKLILSINKYVEKEIWKSIKLLVPYIIDELRLPYSQINDASIDLISKKLLARLGVDVAPSYRLAILIKRVTSEGLQKKPLPSWLKGIIRHRYGQREGIVAERAKQRNLSFNYTLYEEVSELGAL